MREKPFHFRDYYRDFAEEIASKQLSPVDVTSAMLERIESA